MAGRAAQRAGRAWLQTGTLCLEAHNRRLQLANGIHVVSLLLFLFIDLTELGEPGGQRLQLLLALLLRVQKLLAARLQRYEL